MTDSLLDFDDDQFVYRWANLDDAQRSAVGEGGFARYRRLMGEVGKPLPKPAPVEDAPRASSLREFVNSFIVTPEDVAQMEATRFLWKKIIASGHICVWAAPGNGGKTTLARHAAADMARDGLTVLYLQEDAGAGEIKTLVEHAAANGYALLNAGLGHARQSPADQIDWLAEMGHGDDSLTDTVFILDTLKKYLDAMNKREAREFFRILRALTVKGAAILLLGHTNKHRGSDGKLIFEGVGDVRSDVDELFYLDALHDSTRGLLTVTMTPDKWRCAVEPATFVIDLADLSITQSSEIVDTAALAERARQRAEDATVIDAIVAVLEARGAQQQSKLIDAVRGETSIGRDRLLTVLRRYQAGPDALWSCTPGVAFNTQVYALRGDK